MPPIVFCYNPTSWSDGAPVPGGMADALVQPILAHLESGSYAIDRTAHPGAVNVYYAHRSKYPDARREPAGGVGVFVSHGIADKAWRNANRVAPHFGWIFVSGPAWTRKLIDQGANPRMLIEAGYAKLDPLFRDAPLPAYAGPPPPEKRPGTIRVVYAPTHGGGGEAATKRPLAANVRRPSSWWHADEIAQLLTSDEFDVVVAPHPRHRADHRATLAEYRGADVVIADGGSTIYEAWALDIPVVFPSWATRIGNLTRHPDSFEAQLYRERIGYHVPRSAELATTVARAATAGIGVRETDYVEGILPRAYRGSSGQRHAEALLDIAANEVPRHGARTHLVQYRHVSAPARVRSVVDGTAQHRRYERSPVWERI